MRGFAFVASTLAMLFVSSASAQKSSSTDALTSDCHDDRLADRCAPENQRAFRARYNLSSIEELAAQSVQTRRVFFVDGYGREMPVVTFERRADQQPTIVVSARVADENQHAQVVELRETLSDSAWQDVIRQPRTFHQPAPPQTTDSREADALRICLHSWVIRVEASDPLARERVRSNIQDSCNAGSVQAPAFALARIAYEAFPYCRALDLSQYRNEVALLQTCALLQGDRTAAAHALNRVKALDNSNNPNAEAGAFFQSSAEIHWLEENAAGTEALALWQRRNATSNFYTYRIIGENADRVRVVGFVNLHAEENPRRLPAEQIWTRDRGQNFRLSQMSVTAAD